MNTDPTPTVHERAMAEMRAGMARDGLAAVARCIEVLGPGATAYAHWVVVDRTGVLPPEKIPTCRRDGGGWSPPAPDRLERLTAAPEHETITGADGVKRYPFRFQICFEALGEYRPQSAEQLAAARAKRESKLLEKIKEELAMFPELVPSVVDKMGTPAA